MAYDGLFTRKMVESLQFLVDGRIHKINQPENDTIIMVIRQNRKNHQLLLSIHPSFARMHLTNKKYDNPFEPPMFARVFRKHLEGGFIKAIRQIGNDRRVEIDIHSKDEIGDTTYRTVILEIMGKHSNLMLVDDQRKIIEGFKHLTPNTNQYRTVMPGFQYEAPPTQNKTNPYSITGTEVLKFIDFNSGKIARQLLNQFEGFSPLITNEIVNRRHHCQGPHGEEYGRFPLTGRRKVNGSRDQDHRRPDEGNESKNKHDGTEQDRRRQSYAPPAESSENRLNSCGKGQAVDDGLKNLRRPVEEDLPLFFGQWHDLPEILDQDVAVTDEKKGRHGDDDELVNQLERIPQESPGKRRHLGRHPSPALPEYVPEHGEVLFQGNAAGRKPVRKKIQGRGDILPFQLGKKFDYLSVKPDAFPGQKGSDQNGG